MHNVERSGGRVWVPLVFEHEISIVLMGSETTCLYSTMNEMNDQSFLITIYHRPQAHSYLLSLVTEIPVDLFSDEEELNFYIMKESAINFHYPTRITMLDAVTLDTEIFNILKNQLQTILQNVRPGILKQNEVKLDILLHYIIWKLSIGKFRGTFGQQLLNMKYNDRELTTNKKRLLLLFRVVSYLRSNSSLLPSSSTDKLTKSLDIGFNLFELINLLLFFCQGRYSTVTDRLLNLRLICVVDKPRSVGYNYMTRELLWHGFLELFTFTLSIVNYQYLRRKLLRLLPGTVKKKKIVGTLNFTPDTKCAVCQKNPVLPQSFGCPHVFCYYCVQTNRLVDSQFECPSCLHFQEKVTFVHL